MSAIFELRGKSRHKSGNIDILTIDNIIKFIRERELGYPQIAKTHQNWLKKRLGKQFISVLMQHGDPDRDGYLTVLNRWFTDERNVMNYEGN